MDEHKLQELFRGAAPSAPESSFDRGDVVRGSRRITARRRVTASAGALAVAVLALGGVGAGTGWFSPAPDSPSVAGEDPTQRTEPAPAHPGSREDSPGVLAQPRAGNSDQPDEPDSRTCGPPDPGLTEAARETVPGFAGVAPVSVTDPACRPGARAVAFPVHDTGNTGQVRVILRPAEHPVSAGETSRPDGSRQVVRTTDDGRAVVVVRVPDPGSDPPRGAVLPRLADGLAQRY